MEKLAKIFKENFISYFLIAIVAVFCLTLLLMWPAGQTVKSFIGENKEWIFDAFRVEVQVAFIVVSLSTALSTSSKRVYWEEMFTYRLVSPMLTNFTALAAYTLATLAVGLFWRIYAVFWNDIYGTIGVAISFIISVIFMIMLSARMISANFGRDKIKAELENKLTEAERKMIRGSYAEPDKGYLIPEVHRLINLTFQELNEGELDLACENMDLFRRRGYLNELSTVYLYAKEKLAPEQMEEIDYYLFKQAVIVKHDTSIFYDRKIPVSQKSQFDLMRICISEVFDKAAYPWMHPYRSVRRKNEDKQKALIERAHLYIILTKLLWYIKLWKINMPDYDDDMNPIPHSKKDINETWRNILDLMALFVERREDFFMLVGLPEEDWLVNEWDIINKKHASFFPETEPVPENVLSAYGTFCKEHQELCGDVTAYVVELEKREEKREEKRQKKNKETSTMDDLRSVEIERLYRAKDF